MKHEALSKPAGLRTLIAGFCAIAISLSFGGYFYYRYETKTFHSKAYQELKTIAAFKAEQIVAWREEILADARFNANAPFLRTAIQRWFADSGNEILKAELLFHLRVIVEMEDYVDSLIVNLDGQLLLSVQNTRSDFEAECRQLAIEALASGGAVISDFVLSSHTGTIHIDAAVPVFDSDKKPLAVLLLRTDPQKQVYPLIQSWPTPSPSAETLLIRKQDGGVLFLNELRHQARTALTFFIERPGEDLPAARAVAGKTGLFKGRDYRGVEVLADLRPIPNTPWFMVAKVDAREMLAELHYRTGVIFILVLFGVVLSAVFAAWLYRYRQQDLYRELYRSEKRSRQAQEEIRATLYGIGDGVIAADAQGRITRMNPVAEQLTDWKEHEAQNLPLEEVFRIVNEENRTTVENPVNKVLREGMVVGLANHTLLIGKDGDERPIADSGAPIRDEQGRTVGVVLVFRDQTAERAAERALIESEQRYRELFESNPQPMWAYDLETLRFLAVNSAAVDHYGYLREEFLAMTIKDIRPSEDLPRLLENITQVTGGIDHAGVWRHRKKSGEEIHVEITSHTLLFNGRRAELVLATDVTQRLRAEAALRASEENYRQLFNAESDAIFLIDNETGRILQANSAAAAVYGYSCDMLLTMTNTDLSGEPEQTRNMTKHTPIMSDQIVNIPLRWHRKKDGTIFPVEITGRFFMRDGRAVHLAAIRDITERKRAEEALQAITERQDALLEAIPDIVMEVDRRLVYTWANSAGLEFFGHDAVGRPASDYFGEEQEAAEIVQQLFDGSEDTGRSENWYRRHDGEKRLLEWRFRKIKSTRGHAAGAIATARDITDLRSLQEQFLQAQKMESVGRLAGGIAHDFNNMLGVIIGQCELAMDQIDPEQPIHLNLQEVHKAAQRSADLTQQLLTFARKQTIRPKVLDLNETVAGILAMLRRIIGEEIQLRWRPGADLWPIKMDPIQIDQILANLAVNARDAIVGAGYLSIETANAILDEEYCENNIGFHPGAFVKLTVSDDGCGMNKETLARLFEPFFTTKEVGRGTGLGLATIYGVVKQNNGFVKVYSEPGHGSTFSIYLPRTEEKRPTGPMPTRRARPTGSETILLVEDEEAVLKLGKNMLQRHGYTVLTGKTSDEALDAAQRYPGPIHLLITDVIMPGINGRVLKERISILRPEIKVLYMSGYTAEIIDRHGALETDVEFIQKPFSMDALTEKVRKVLDRE